MWWCYTLQGVCVKDRLMTAALSRLGCTCSSSSTASRLCKTFESRVGPSISFSKYKPCLRRRALFAAAVSPAHVAGMAVRVADLGEVEQQQPHLLPPTAPAFGRAALPRLEERDNRQCCILLCRRLQSSGYCLCAVGVHR